MAKEKKPKKDKRALERPGKRNGQTLIATPFERLRVSLLCRKDPGTGMEPGKFYWWIFETTKPDFGQLRGKFKAYPEAVQLPFDGFYKVNLIRHGWTIDELFPIEDEYWELDDSIYTELTGWQESAALIWEKRKLDHPDKYADQEIFPTTNV